MSDQSARRRKSDFEPEILSREEMRSIFREEGQKLLVDTFDKFGVDITSSKDRNRLRDNLLWVDSFRVATNDAVVTVRRIGLATVAGGLLAALWAGLKFKTGAS